MRRCQSLGDASKGHRPRALKKKKKQEITKRRETLPTENARRIERLGKVVVAPGPRVQVVGGVAGASQERRQVVALFQLAAHALQALALLVQRDRLAQVTQACNEQREQKQSASRKAGSLLALRLAHFLKRKRTFMALSQVKVLIDDTLEHLLERLKGKKCDYRAGGVRRRLSAP